MGKFATVALLVLSVLLACDYPADSPLPEGEPEIKRVDFDSDVAYRNAKRRAAYREMHHLPPDEFRAFMRRNEWKRRWPEMWGPEDRRERGFNIIAGWSPAPFPDATEMAKYQAMHDRHADSAEEAMGWVVGKPRASLQEFREYLLAQWTKQVEEHARRWDGERCDESPWMRGHP